MKKWYYYSSFHPCDHIANTIVTKYIRTPSPQRLVFRLWHRSSIRRASLGTFFYLGRGLLVTKVAWEICGELRHEHPHTLLVFFILGILARRDELCKPRRRLEKKQVCKGAKDRPVVHGGCDIARPLIQCEPNSLLGREIGMATPGPEACDNETTVKVFLLELIWYFGSFQVGMFCSLEVYSL